ncbi:MAG TPA: ChbG/HpnK family deacetylase [Gemmataceae bacterium]|nr:ChbG/HpnK family deacetylase [Gemmataceae bacterium]
MFRAVLLELMPAKLLGEHFHPTHGRPTKELFAMAGLLFLQEAFDWTNVAAVEAVLFRADVQFALRNRSEMPTAGFCRRRRRQLRRQPNLALTVSRRPVIICRPLPGALRLSRPVAIVADDYGIGAETSRAILELAREERVTATVLIVNAPDAERAVRAWLDASPPADLGWHPNLTLDRPMLPPAEVPSLVRADGSFWPLGAFLRRVCLGQIRSADVRAEWVAQYRRFVELVGRPPALVNSHQHVSLFPPCDAALFDVFREANVRPYMRRVIEPIGTLARVPGARIKRTTLNILGRRAARRAAACGVAGADWLAGVTDPGCINDRFWDRWLGELANTGSIELCCHPGFRDDTLIGRDCDEGDGLLRRPREATLLRSPSFRDACARAGLVPIRPSALPGVRTGGP